MRPMAYRLRDLPGPARLAIALFVLLLGGFYLAAQATLWVRDGGGRLPGYHDVLVKYHGTPETSPLHEVLSADRPPTSPRAMWVYLDPLQDPESIQKRREVILSWVEEGAPESGWPAVGQVMHQEASCLQCHAPGGQRADLPFETYEEVRAVARAAPAISTSNLLVTAHNHAFAFSVLALLLSLLVVGTGAPGALKALLVASAFGGAVLDVGGWFATRAFGDPWPAAVLVGGGAFGAAIGTMALLALFEVVVGPRRGRRLAGDADETAGVAGTSDGAVLR